MRLICCLVVLMFYHQVGAQFDSQALRSYHQVLEQTVVLKNTDHAIPIKDLSTVHLGLITPNDLQSSLKEYLELYAPVLSIPVYKLDHKELINVNLLLVEIDLAKTNHQTLTHLSEQLDHNSIPYVVLFLHGSALVLPEGYFKAARGIIFSWGYSEYSGSQVAQVLFGAVESTHRLPFTLNKIYKTGAGISTTALGRLKYGPPEYVGIDGAAFVEKLNDAVNHAMEDSVFPGANLLVAKNGMVIYHQAFGKPTFESHYKVQKTDLYDLASITKIFGATLASMALHSQGLFDPNKTLADYLPDFKKSNKHQLMWKDILTHRARLPASIAFYRRTLDSLGIFLPRTVRSKPNRRYSIAISDHLFLHRRYPKVMMKGIKKAPLLNKEGYVYSDLSMILLHKTVESITRESFSQFLTRSFYKPLGANHTGFVPASRFDLDRIIPTERDSVFRHELVHGRVHDENAAMLGGVSGHAGLFSHANDLAKLAQLLLNKGSYGGIQYLKPETVELYTSYQYPEIGNRRGLGFDKPLLQYDLRASHVAREASPESFGHSGFTGTFIWMDPKYNLTYILLTNRVYPSRINNKISQYSIRPCIQQIIYDFIVNADHTKTDPE